MRILIVVCDTGRGGVQRGARNFAEGFARAGHEVRVLVAPAGRGEAEPAVSGEGYEVLALKADGALPDGVVSFSPDAVQVHAHLLRWEVVTDLRRRFPSATFVEQSIWSRWMPSTRYADLICHQSPWMADVFRARTAFRRRPAELVLGAPVEVDRFSEPCAGGVTRFRDRLGITPGDILVGRAGQANETKWHRCLVDSFAVLAPGDPRLHLLVIAPPASVKGQIANLPDGVAGRAHVIDWLDGDGELRVAYAAMDVFAHAAHRGESFGFVLIEAMASGTPVITLSTPYRDNAQLDWVLDGAAGQAAGSPQEFTERLRRLTQEPDERARSGERGMKFATRFTTDAICQELVGVLMKRVQSSRAPGAEVQPHGGAARLRSAGLSTSLVLRLLLRARFMLSWSYKGDRVWNELTRLWIERVEWRRASGSVGSALAPLRRSGRA